MWKTRKPGSVAKAATYAQKAVTVAKADAPDADRARKLSAGIAHSTLGYAYMKQDKTVAAVPELKSASSLLKGLDDQQYAVALYRLGYAYAKLNRVKRSPGHTDGGTEDSRAGPAALAGSAGEGKCGARQRKIISLEALSS